jgi:poly(3-hydroxyoctanoate) depolymerase
VTVTDAARADRLGVVDRHGLRIAYAVRGDGSRPLLLLNGLGQAMQTWEPFLAASPGRTTVMLDAPGVGASKAPAAPVSISAHARLATDVLDASGYDTVDVLGYSHGGLVAQELARQHPRRVRRLILVATSCGLGATLGERLATAPWTSLRQPTSGPALDAMLSQLFAAATWSSIGFLGSLSAKTLVVHGTEDDLSPHSNGALLARRIPDAQLRLVPAGHDLTGDLNAPRLAQLVAEFLGIPSP